MGSHTTSQFPNSFDRIEFRAVRRHEFQCKALSTFFPPIKMQPGMVVFDIVEDYNNVAIGMTTDTPQLLEKGKESHAVETFPFLRVDELAIPDANSAKIADSLAGGMMQENRIGDFRRNPHSAGGTMLLKPNLIYGPDVESIIMRKIMEFFYMLPAVRDWRAPSLDEVYENGTPGPETNVGIAERQAKLPIFVG